MPMSIATFNSNADAIVTAINAGDIGPVDVKANTSSIVTHAVPLLVALQNMLAKAGYAALNQPDESPLYP